MTSDRDRQVLEHRLRLLLESDALRPDPGLAGRVLARATAEEQRPQRVLATGFGAALATAAVIVMAAVAGLALGNLPSTHVVPGAEASQTAAPTDATPPPASVEATPAASPGASTTPRATASADPTTNRCVNEVDGFQVGYPADWYTNDELEQEFDEPTPACRYFGEEPLDLAPNAGLAPTVAIRLIPTTDRWRQSDGTAVVCRDEIEVDGRPATVTELEWIEDGGPFFAVGDRSFEVRIDLGDGAALVADTASTANGSYEAHVVVLREMVGDLDLDETSGFTPGAVGDC